MPKGAAREKAGHQKSSCQCLSDFNPHRVAPVFSRICGRAGEGPKPEAVVVNPSKISKTLGSVRLHHYEVSPQVLGPVIGSLGKDSRALAGVSGLHLQPRVGPYSIGASIS